MQQPPIPSCAGALPVQGYALPGKHVGSVDQSSTHKFEEEREAQGQMRSTENLVSGCPAAGPEECRDVHARANSGGLDKNVRTDKAHMFNDREPRNGEFHSRFIR